MTDKNQNNNENQKRAAVRQSEYRELAKKLGSVGAEIVKFKRNTDEQRKALRQVRLFINEMLPANA